MIVSSENHAARLRMISYCMGMLTHCDRKLIGDGSDWMPDVRNVVRAIYPYTPITWRDLRAYAVSGRDRLSVKMSEDGSYRFGIKFEP